MRFERGQRVVIVGCQTHPQANGMHCSIVSGPHYLESEAGEPCTGYVIDPDRSTVLPHMADARVLRPVDDQPGSWEALRNTWIPNRERVS